MLQFRGVTSKLVELTSLLEWINNTNDLSPNTAMLFLEPSNSELYYLDSYYWFVPNFNESLVFLRLDSQFFTYNIINNSDIIIDEHYKVKDKKFKNQAISHWNRNKGFLDKGEFIWVRRRNLSGVELIITANSYAQLYYIDSATGEPKGFFPAMLDAYQVHLNAANLV